MSSINPGPEPERPSPEARPRTAHNDITGRVGLLTDRQRSYLRLVAQFKSSKEIAAATGTASYRAIDKQLLKANTTLGVATRFEAAQMLAVYEQRVEPLPATEENRVEGLPAAGDPVVERLHPANALPSAIPVNRLFLPWPTAGAAANMLPWKQVAAWITIIAIVTPVGLTAAGMAYFTLLLLLRLLPS